MLLLDQLLFSGMSFLLTIFSSRYFDIYTFGIFASLVIGLYLLLSISQALIIQPMQIFLNRTENPLAYKGFLLKCLFGFILVILLVSSILYSLEMNALSDFNDRIIAFVCYSIAFIMHDFFRKFFLSNDQIKDVLIIDFVAVFSQSILLCYLLFFVDGNLNLLLFGLFLAYIPALLIAFFKFPFSFWVGPQRVFLNYHYKEGKWLFFMAITQWFSNNLFVIFSGVFIGITALAALRLGQTIFGILNIILQTVENYLIPYVNRLYAKSHQEGMHYLRKMSKGGFLIMLIFSIPFLFFSKSIMYWIGGKEYVIFHYVLKGLCLLYLVIFSAYPVRISMRILELNKFFFIGYLISLLISMIYFQFLLSHFQLQGAIAGLILNQLIMLAVWQYTLTRKKFYLWKSYT